MTWVIVVAAAFVALVVASRWSRARTLRRLRRASRVVRTAKGDVEYARLGSGPAVVVLHGGLGGFDQGLGIGASLLTARDELIGFDEGFAGGDERLRGRFTLIAPSRAGYLRTPIASGRTPREAADAVAALLDELGIARAIVMGVSSGGPTALELALAHPDRTAALVLVSPVTRRLEHLPETRNSLAGRLAFARSTGWMLELGYGAVLVGARVFPRMACSQVLRATETFGASERRARLAGIAQRAELMRWFQSLLRSGHPFTTRKAGLDHDLGLFAELADSPVERIACPALVVHGRNDASVPYADSERAARSIPGAEFHTVESCGHFVWLAPEFPALRRAVVAFAERHGHAASALA